MYSQAPAPPEQSPPFNGGTPDDVWLYTDDHDTVVEIPRRGTWRPNRIHLLVALAITICQLVFSDLHLFAAGLRILVHFPLEPGQACQVSDNSQLWLCAGLSPGWPELLGTEYKSAIETILADLLGVVVVWGPDGFIRPFDININRVFLDVDDQGKVARVPRRG